MFCYGVDGGGRNVNIKSFGVTNPITEISSVLNSQGFFLVNEYQTKIDNFFHIFSEMVKPVLIFIPQLYNNNKVYSL